MKTKFWLPLLITCAVMCPQLVLAGTLRESVSLLPSDASLSILTQIREGVNLEELSQEREEITYVYGQLGQEPPDLATLNGTELHFILEEAQAQIQEREVAHKREVQANIVAAAYTTPTTPVGYCAQWVIDVYRNAGLDVEELNACDMYWRYCTSADTNELSAGMIIAVPSHSKSGSAGLRYGHIGIYVGDGLVMDSTGTVNTRTLEEWTSYYGTDYAPQWGFAARF